MSGKCRYLVASEEAYRIGDKGEKLGGAVVRLCSWGESAPTQLVDTPRWLQRNALAGHLWNEGDCTNCPAFAPTPINP